MDWRKQEAVIANRLADLKETVTVKNYDYRYDESKEVEDYLLSVFKQVGDVLLANTERRDFVIDSDNDLIVRYLIAYLCRWSDRFAELSRKLTNGQGDINAPILMMGEKGVGKTLLMRVASKFAFVSQLHSRSFYNTSSSVLLNSFRVKGDLDSYTFNTREQPLVEGYPHTAKPMGVCLHDLGIERDEGSKQKIYGTDMGAVVNDFLMARYELYQNSGLMFHITTNLDMAKIIKSYPPRIVDRFKDHNQIYVRGKSRRGRY